MLIAQAPLRVSLFGGGSDLPAYLKLNDGAVLSFAINRRVYLIGHPFTHRSGILLKYSTTEDVQQSSDLKHPIAREVFTRYAIQNMDVAVMSDVPAGTGLGSSSSFTVACIAFSRTIAGKELHAKSIAREACEVEIDVLREPIGYQDQWAAALGGVNVLEFSQRDVNVQALSLTREVISSLESNLFLVPIGNPRSAGTLLREQQSNLEVDSRAVRLTRSLVDLVAQGTRALRGRVDDLGPLLNEAWEIKREIAQGVSNSQIDSAYASGISAGATGGKLLGAGGGGYFAFYVPSDTQERFAQEFSQRLLFKVSMEGAGVIHES